MELPSKEKKLKLPCAFPPGTMISKIRHTFSMRFTNSSLDHEPYLSIGISVDTTRESLKVVIRRQQAGLDSLALKVERFDG